MKGCILLAVALIAVGAVAETPALGWNVLKNSDLRRTDGLGGVVGWMCRKDGGATVSARPLDDGVIEVVYTGTGTTYFTQSPVILKSGARYRLSAEVESSISTGGKVLFAVWDQGWRTTWRSPDFPSDTKGAFQKVSWDFTPSTQDKLQRFTIALSGKVSASGSTTVRLRHLALEPLSAEADPETKSIPDEALVPFVARIVPIDPLLSEVRAASARITCYWPGEASESVASYFLEGCVDRGAVRKTRLTASARATLDFGSVSVGAHRLALRVVSPDGRTVATNDYAFTAQAEPPRGPAGRRLNNLVTELVKADLRNGEVRFFRPTWGCVWISFDGANDEARGFVDGETTPAVVRRPGEKPLAGFRWVEAGWHTLRVTGATRGQVRIHAVKYLAMPECGRRAPRCDFEGSAYTFSYPFWRRFVLPNLNVALNAKEALVWLPEASADYCARGILLWGGAQIGWGSPNWLDPVGQWQVLTGGDWGKGFDISVNESSIFAQRRHHVTTAESIWKMYAARPHQRVNLYWGDATEVDYADPRVHVSELLAIANTGDGRGLLLPESYVPVMRRPEELDRWIDLFERQLKTVAEIAPAARASTVFHTSTWLDPCHWNDYPYPESDVKATYARLFQTFATRPGFADIAGLSSGGTTAGDEEVRRWMALLFRYYGLEGGTENLADVYGYRWRPDFVKNVDFLDGLQEWSAEGQIRPDRIACYGTRVQGRQKVPESTGETFASFVSSAERVNRLSQKLTGLKPGRFYALHFCAANRADVEKPSGGEPPLAFRARLEGAEEVADLRYRHLARNSNRVTLPIYRYVFRAKTAEATLVFEDRREDGAAVSDGTEQILNYIIFRPYYVETPEEVTEIATFLK